MTMLTLWQSILQGARLNPQHYGTAVEEAMIKEVAALSDAMDQLLDDMGHDGQCVCLAAKAQARIAFEPFMEPDAAEIYMPLDEAKRIAAEADQR